MLLQFCFGTASRVSPPLVLSPRSIPLFYQGHGSIPLCTASRVSPPLFYGIKTRSFSFSLFSLLSLEGFFCSYTVSSSTSIFFHSRRDLFLYSHHILWMLSIATLRRVFFPLAPHIPHFPLLHYQSDIFLCTCTTLASQKSTGSYQIHHLFERFIRLPGPHKPPPPALRTLQSCTPRLLTVLYQGVPRLHILQFRKPHLLTVCIMVRPCPPHTTISQTTPAQSVISRCVWPSKVAIS